MGILWSILLLGLAIAVGMWGYNKFLKPCNC
jgi:hypothetical protein